jgi:plasmid maintenance system antidote protein VapI
MKVAPKPYRPDVPIPPGAVLWDCLRERPASDVQAFADLLGIDGTGFLDLLAGRMEITAEMAAAMGEFFGWTAHIWMNLERSYRAALAE